MGTCTWVVLSLVVGVAAILFSWNSLIFMSPLTPQFEDGWFGSGNQTETEDMVVRPFEVQVISVFLNNLLERLKRVQLHDDLEEGTSERGFQSESLRELLQYWRQRYLMKDWDRHDRKLNRFPQYKTNIEGLDIHFVRVKPTDCPEDTRPVPLLMIHGWLSSYYEFYNIIPELTAKVEFADPKLCGFEVVVPSIPGFGFSEASNKRDFSPLDAARILYKLMKRLGFGRYFVQGGHSGGNIGNILAVVKPRTVRGLHLNSLFVPHFAPSLLQQIASTLLSTDFLGGKHAVKNELFDLRATGVDTIGLALGDSPAGLAAFFLDRHEAWTRYDLQLLEDGELARDPTLDDLITQVMVYWVSKCISSALRFSQEALHNKEFGQFSRIAFPSSVPVGLICFTPDDCSMQRVSETYYPNITSVTQLSHVGRFAAMREPQLFAEDVIQFVRKAVDRT